MRLFRGIVACYLALCFALAGAVSVSPFLHRLIEHGGQGPAHVHFGFSSTIPTVAEAHEHVDFHWHGHSHIHISERPQPTGMFTHSFRPFELPGIPLDALCHLLGHFLAVPASSGPIPSDSNPGHQHHDFFQLMSRGLADQPLPYLLLPIVPVEFVWNDLPAKMLSVGREWEAQTASRGPPSARS